MILFYILLGIFILFSLRPNRKGFNVDYLSIPTTNAVKGIFILLVFIKHATPYVVNSGYVGSKVFNYVDTHVGQWIVAMFLFYSGYGIMESIAKKGEAYVNSIPAKRVLTVLVNFDIAVLCFIVVALILGKTYSPLHYLLSLIGWEAVGNSNWYIFVIMLCYLIAYVSFRKNRYIHTYIQGAVLCFILLALSVIALSFVKPNWWFDTMLCFGAGIFYSIFKEKIEGFVKRHYWSTLGVLLLILVGIHHIPLFAKGLVYNAFCIVFCGLIVTFSMRVQVNSRALIWCGQNLFPLYIYQRIPMIILAEVGGGVFISSYPVVYTFCCLVITTLLAYCYRYWAIKL